MDPTAQFDLAVDLARQGKEQVTALSGPAGYLIPCALFVDEAPRGILYFVHHDDPHLMVDILAAAVGLTDEPMVVFVAEADLEEETSCMACVGAWDHGATVQGRVLTYTIEGHCVKWGMTLLDEAAEEIADALQRGFEGRAARSGGALDLDDIAGRFGLMALDVGPIDTL